MLWTVLFSIFITSCNGVIERPRGVPPSKASSYQPNAEQSFTCLSTPDGSVVSIPFIYVNDDYCDCEDGSDEPGTAACENSRFYCENKGYKGEYILSSRVNDGICDCCDGSDEYSGDKIQCGNMCIQLGLKQREELLASKKLREAGYKVKQEYMQKGKIARDEKQSRLKQVEQEQEEMINERTELEAKKKEVEEPEKVAKDVHEAAWNEQKAQKEKEKEHSHALQVFDELDVNDDDHVDVHEMRTHEEFDVDSDGTVSHDEAKEYLEDLEKAGKDEFLEKIWPNIKEIYKSAKQEAEDKGDKEGENQEGDSEEPSTTETTVSPPPETATEEKKDEDVMPEYDEETKRLIEAADAARQKYDDVDKKVRDIENEISGLKKYLETDFGPEQEFAFLENQCFEYSDREYTYKLCPFNRASQRPKVGGTETSLGLWGHWEGSGDNKYSAQKYERGQNCWNGPDRSVKILFQCGSENAILSASEPSRCEYQFEFATPAVCKPLSLDEEKSELHDEL
ncbi:glucosidase 2 subunit beta-like isoform X2 [Gigantopelta aegis]|uniref:glucosidase 2 subunit beta-like isoform X2 n=1 Tax=Gigantopelta aegis TaxID=1735272 RepID=UPI001B88C9D0|nr:glucosidase 2 subunit beta-like isoform X2 [Gigantopelta aegis]